VYLMLDALSCVFVSCCGGGRMGSGHVPGVGK
jgi:hypothetical protein